VRSRPLFEASHAPYDESDAGLRNLFNIHSGGAEGTIKFQIQTFKALCDNADFRVMPSADASLTSTGAGQLVPGQRDGQATDGRQGTPIIHIDLHIHLPENKSRRDYEYGALWRDENVGGEQGENIGRTRRRLKSRRQGGSDRVPRIQRQDDTEDLRTAYVFCVQAPESRWSGVRPAGTEDERT
jgi:hypothetical protein